MSYCFFELVLERLALLEDMQSDFETPHSDRKQCYEPYLFAVDGWWKQAEGGKSVVPLKVGSWPAGVRIQEHLALGHFLMQCEVELKAVTRVYHAD